MSSNIQHEPLNIQVDRESFKSNKLILSRNQKNSVPLISCGSILNNLDVQIFDPETHRVLKELEVGEILIAGDSVTQGYLGVIDAEAHACLFDGARIAVANGAKLLLFKHNDLESLENKLKIAKEQRSGGILIITDGIFSMKGDMAPLKDIIHLKKKYEARLFVDDAHGGGVMGEQGRGTSHFLKVSQDVDLLMYIFSKAFGSIGGIICGNASIISYLRFNSRTNIFSHNMTSIHARKTLNSLYLLQSTPSLLEDLWKNTYLLQKMLQENGFNIGTTNSPITPIFLRNTLGIPDIEYLFIKLSCLCENNMACLSLALPIQQCQKG